MEIGEHELEQLLQKQAKAAAQEVAKDTERYIGILEENMNHKLEAMTEMIKTVPAIKETVDLTFEKVGEVTVDLEILKEAVKDHEQRLQKVETQ